MTILCTTKRTPTLLNFMFYMCRNYMNLRTTKFPETGQSKIAYLQTRTLAPPPPLSPHLDAIIMSEQSQSQSRSLSIGQCNFAILEAVPSVISPSNIALYCSSTASYLCAGDAISVREFSCVPSFVGRIIAVHHPMWQFPHSTHQLTPSLRLCYALRMVS
ncbi:hypothetical protein HJC23_000981 [Cyclotella cryptica]|uniref:Uncharacterized protein n=1 Tax=Cyclotella cryptica TaxID=29204 RepID=A0ABD3QMD4_9STRA